MENDPGHLGRLLQLILGVAINCDSKTDHIQALLTMEQDVQRVVMMAIQVLEEIWPMKHSFVKNMQELTGEGGEPSPSLPTIEDDAALAQLMKVQSWKDRHCYGLDSEHNLKGILFHKIMYLPFKGHGKHQEWKGATCPKVPRLGNAAKPYEGGEVQLIRCILRPIPLQDFPRISFWGLIIGFPLKIQIMCYKPQFAP